VQRKNLVIVRAGRSSLHPDWLAGSRTWDLIVSTYDPAAAFPAADGVIVDLAPGFKWRGLAATIARHRDLIDRYERIWLPDDDIATDAVTINRLFDLHRRFGLELSQPSLSADSYYTHDITMAHPGFFLRFTNFVEVMVPLFSKRLFDSVAADFAGSDSGWGFDNVWHMGSEFPRVAILDCLQVHHTRPLGEANYKDGYAASHGEKLAHLSKKFATSRDVYTAATLAAVLSDGKVVSLTNPRQHLLMTSLVQSSQYLNAKNPVKYSAYTKDAWNFSEKYLQMFPPRHLERQLAHLQDNPLIQEVLPSIHLFA